jgi:uncharacterized protein (DUF302 family)
VKIFKTELEKNGETTKILKFSDVVKEYAGKSFPDYSLILACNAKENIPVIQKDLALSLILPCSIVVYDAGKGNIKINIAEPDSYAELVNASPEGKKYAVDTYDRIIKILKLKIKPGKKTQPGNVFYIREIINKKTELSEMNLLLVTYLQNENLNVIYSSDNSKELTMHFICSAGVGDAILRTMPEFGVFAPCRILLSKKEDKIRIGYMNTRDVVKSNKAQIGKKGLEAADKLDESVLNALDMLTGN